MRTVEPLTPNSRADRRALAIEQARGRAALRTRGRRRRETSSRPRDRTPGCPAEDDAAKSVSMTAGPLSASRRGRWSPHRGCRRVPGAGLGVTYVAGMEVDKPCTAPKSRRQRNRRSTRPRRAGRDLYQASFIVTLAALVSGSDRTCPRFLARRGRATIDDARFARLRLNSADHVALLGCDAAITRATRWSRTVQGIDLDVRQPALRQHGGPAGLAHKAKVKRWGDIPHPVDWGWAERRRATFCRPSSRACADRRRQRARA